MMTIKDHPKFAHQFQHWFIRAWLIDVVLFAGSLYYFKHHDMLAGWLFAIGFGLFTAFTLGYAYYQLFHVRCPQCSHLTTTQKSTAQRSWIAQCPQCNITWRLNIGTRQVN